MAPDLPMWIVHTDNPYAASDHKSLGIGRIPQRFVVSSWAVALTPVDGDKDHKAREMMVSQR
jgi:hypothetical protein